MLLARAFVALRLIGWIATGLAGGAGSMHAGVETMPTDGRTVYRLGLAQVAGARLIVGSTYDNRLCAWDEAGRHRWDASLGGFGYDVVCADLDGDGTDEILVAGADGGITCISAAGRERWRHVLAAPVLQVTVARLDGKTPVVIAGGVSRELVVLAASGAVVRTVALDSATTTGSVRVLRAGDFDGDRRDEVALLTVRGRRAGEVVFVKGEEMKPLPMRVAVDDLDRANTLAVDLEGDGRSELLTGERAVGLTEGKARVLFELPPAPQPLSYDHSYRMRNVAVGNFTGGPGLEIVTVDGPEVILHDAAGKVIAAAHGPLGFTDVVLLPGSPHSSVILGSGTGGDDNLYRVRFDADWKAQLEKLPRRGRLERISTGIEQLAAKAAAWQGEPMRGAGGPFDVIVPGHMMGPRVTPKSVATWIEEVRFFEKQFPYSKLRFAACFWPGEKRPLLRPDGATWSHDRRLGHQLSREDLAGMAREFEAAGVHFWVQVGHGCSPHLSVEGVKAMLQAAPKTCLGFVSAEDEQAGEMVYYLRHFIQPILELCRQQGKKFILRNKNIWWLHWPADPEVRELIFNGRYRSVILPAVEDSNSRTSDAQLAARVGLWLNGDFDDWAVRACADWFNFARTWEWESVMTGHPQLRYYVSQAMLGARVFMLGSGELERRSHAMTRVGREGAAPFLHLLGRGALTPPTRAQMASVSPVVLHVPQASERFARRGANGHGHHKWNEDGSDTQRWALERLDCYWGMAPLPATDLSTYLWGRTRRSADHIPVTAPHGFVSVVSGSKPRLDGPWKTIWTTDGDTLVRDGKKHSLEAARELMQRDLAAGMAEMPLDVEGTVFHQVIAQSADHYVIALVDPGWVDPAERRVRLKARQPGRWTVRDRVTGQTFGTLSPSLEIVVPAGAFRLLDCRRE